jgi:hypothetical protein
MTGKVNLARWSPHLAAAHREGKSLAQYARERGLSAYTLYAARQMTSRRDRARGTPRMSRFSPQRTLPIASAFAAVKIAAAPMSALAPRLQAQLPNGVRLELVWGGAETELLSAAIEALAGR